MMIDDKFAEELKSYVYVYTDPRDGIPFYIGKGIRGRVLAHLDELFETEEVPAKNARIADIRRCGLEPQIDFLRHGLTDMEAKLVEAAAIDLIGLANLTNLKRGDHPTSYGRITLKDLEAIYKAKPVDVDPRHKVILITINRLYRSDMSPLELYETTRGIWVVGTRREKAEYAMCVVRGIVHEVYRIDAWYPSGTLEYQTRDASEFRGRGRWEFSGSVAQDIRDQYVGFLVGKGHQNPIRYANV